MKLDPSIKDADSTTTLYQERVQASKAERQRKATRPLPFEAGVERIQDTIQLTNESIALHSLLC